MWLFSACKYIHNMILYLIIKDVTKMDEKKTDRRTLKTQKQLKIALAELLAEKEIRHITIQELSDKADVHRVTFYKHYYDIYDLYEQFENEILSQLGLLILGLSENKEKDFSIELIDYIANNKSIFKMIFSRHNTGELRYRFLTMIEGVFRLIQSENNTIDVNDGRLDFLSAYFSSGYLAVIEKWVHKDFAQPKDFIIETLSDLDEHMDKFMTEQFGK